MTNAPEINRRQLIAAFAFGGLGMSVGNLYAASNFWNRKEPDSWTSDEVLQLATRSPWAVQARVVPRAGHDKGSGQPLAPEVGGGRSGGRGTGPDPVVIVAEVTVVWASAPPLLAALKSSFPPDFANHYVISVNDLPPGPRNKPVNPDSMEADLQTKTKNSVGSGAMQITREAASFAFSKELLPLHASDKEAFFSLRTEQFSIRARFDLKEMTWHGQLAV